MEEKKVYLTTSEARKMVKDKFLSKSAPSLPTIITWAKQYNLGFKFVGRWKIDKEAMIKFLLDRSK